MLQLVPLEKKERSRTYTFEGGEVIRIENVTGFLARPSGTHRLETEDGKLHIVSSGWLHIEIDSDGFTL